CPGLARSPTPGTARLNPARWGRTFPITRPRLAAGCLLAWVGAQPNDGCCSLSGHDPDTLRLGGRGSVPCQPGRPLSWRVDRREPLGDPQPALRSAVVLQRPAVRSERYEVSDPAAR